ncbi:MAG: hypothetical protein MJZ42_03360 [Bacteroidales bacterium]|nr:hypothetical protein [Bacteroidales bacterium]
MSPASINLSAGGGALTPTDVACPSSGAYHGGKKGCTLQRFFSHKQAPRLQFSKRFFQSSQYLAQNRPKFFLQIRTFLLFQSGRKSTKTPFPTAFSASKCRMRGGKHINNQLFMHIIQIFVLTFACCKGTKCFSIFKIFNISEGSVTKFYCKII